MATNGAKIEAGLHRYRYPDHRYPLPSILNGIYGPHPGRHGRLHNATDWHATSVLSDMSSVEDAAHLPSASVTKALQTITESPLQFFFSRYAFVLMMMVCMWQLITRWWL